MFRGATIWPYPGSFDPVTSIMAHFVVMRFVFPSVPRSPKWFFPWDFPINILLSYLIFSIRVPPILSSLIWFPLQYYEPSQFTFHSFLLFHISYLQTFCQITEHGIDRNYRHMFQPWAIDVCNTGIEADRVYWIVSLLYFRSSWEDLQVS
jgi:hypothetical protein